MGRFVALTIFVLLALPAIPRPSLAQTRDCSIITSACDFPDLRPPPYDPDYLATTPEAWRGLPGPGCVPGQTNPRAAGTCVVIRDQPDTDEGVGGGQTPGPGEGDAPAPPPPPPPPTAAEILASCPAPPAPALGVNPVQRGVTGLETYLWASPAEPLSTGGTIRGYAVGCRLEPVRWTFSTGDGATYSSDHAGGPAPDHVAAHVYDARNEPGEDYTIDLTVTWRRITNVSADTVTVSDSRPYHVVEVRSAPQG